MSVGAARTLVQNDPGDLLIRFDGLGGAQTALLTRARGEPKATIAVAPALGLRASYYQPLADRLADAGYHAAIVELPGHGSSPVRAGWRRDWGYPELIDHLARAREALAPLSPRFVWLGHSLGGQLALLETGRSGRARGVVLVASGSPWWRAFPPKDALRIRVGAPICDALGRALGYYPGERVGFGGREARSLIAQWARLARTGEYRFDGLDGDAMLRQMERPVLAVRIEGDALAPERAVEHTLHKLRTPAVERHVWTGLPPANIHNRWPRVDGFPLARVAEFVDHLPR